MKKFLILLLLFFTTDSFATGISGGTSAPCDNDTLNKYTGTANVEINWEPNTINLNWYNGDEKLTVANNSQSCVYDGTLTVPTQPTKPGYTFNGWKVIRVPGGFTELEYVTNAKNTYLDTGIIPNADNTEMEIKVKPRPGSWYIFQARYPDRSFFGFGGSEQGDTINNYYADSSISRVSGHIIIAKSTCINGNATLYVKDLTENIEDTATGSYTSWQQTLPIWMFGNQIGNRVTSGNSVYYAKMKINGVDVMNYIPALRNSDNAVGFYDTISGTFKTVSEGSLTAGPVVQ